MWSAVLVVALWFNVTTTTMRVLAADTVPPLVQQETRPITPPLHLLKARGVIGANGQAGSGLSPLGLTSDRQSYYTVIKAGDINFRVALDTGSSDLWIVSSGCETTQCKSVPRYPLTYQSPTFVAISENTTVFNASYADGSVASGFVASESIQLANLTLSGQPFGLIRQSNVTFKDQVSGILGLGFPRLSSISKLTNSTPFFPTLAYQGLLEYPLFGLNLPNNSSAGSLSIGAIDTSVVNNTDRISWNRVASFPPFVNAVNETIATYLQWAITLSSFAVNGTSLLPDPTYPTIGGGRSLALIDAGSSGIVGPFQDVSRIFSTIDGARLVDAAAGQYIVPCDTLVPLTFTFGSANYTLLPEDYIIGPASGNPNLCLSWPRASPPSSDGIDWQFGAPFLRTVYSIYSFGIDSKESPLIGFYPLRNSTQISNIIGSQTPESISAYLSSISATVATTLPNVLLPTPTYSTPAYIMNSSVSAVVGAVVTSGLAASTYSAIFGSGTAGYNMSALPTITPDPVISTVVVTDQAGQVQTSTTTYVMAAVTLGVPPGWSSGASLRDSSSFSWPVLSVLLCMVSLFWVDVLP